MSILSVKNLVVGYEKKPVVQGINFEIKKGDVLCLLGANGSGKTTILRTLAGLLKPLGGVIMLKNKDLCKMTENRVAKEMAVVLTERVSLGLLTIFEVVAMGRYAHTGFFGKLKKKDIKIIEQALEMVNAIDLADCYMHELSDGEKQKAFLARALVQESDLIIMDEPTSFLDIKHKVEFTAIINDLSKQKNITIVVSLHDLALAARCSDHLMLVKDGQILDYGCPQAILTDEKIKALYEIADDKYEQFLKSPEGEETHNRLSFVNYLL